jgi:hypothetical protein
MSLPVIAVGPGLSIGAGGALPVIHTLSPTAFTTAFPQTVVTQHQNVNLITNINQGGNIGGTSGAAQPSSWLKILNTIAKILCGVAVALIVWNIIKKWKQLGKGQLWVKITGQGVEVKTPRWFTSAFKTVDLFLFLDATGHLLTNTAKTRLLDEAVKQHWIRLKPGRQKGPYPNNYEMRGDAKRLANRGDFVDQPGGTRDGLDEVGLQVGDISTTKFYYDPTNIGALDMGARIIDYKDWGSVSKSEGTLASFFGINKNETVSNCQDKDCGSVRVRAKHPIVQCLAEGAGAEIANCDEFLCKNYTYYIQLVMMQYPAFFPKMSPKGRADFHRAYVNNGQEGEAGIITIPQSTGTAEHKYLEGAAFVFHYNDNGVDLRVAANEKFNVGGDTKPFDGDYTHTEGEDMDATPWAKEWGNPPYTQTEAGICCDPYTDNDGFDDYDKNGTKVLWEGEPAVAGAMTSQYSIVGLPEGGVYPGTDGLEFPMAVISPRFREIRYAERANKSSLDELIEDLQAENAKARLDTGIGEDVHTPEDLQKVFKNHPLGKKYIHSRAGTGGYKIYKRGAGWQTLYPLRVFTNEYAMSWSTIAKACDCAKDAQFAPATASDQMHSLVVGAVYRISLVRVGFHICKGRTFEFPGEDVAENKAEFMVNCRKDGSAPGNTYLDVTYGYQYAGGNRNREGRGAQNP